MPNHASLYSLGCTVPASATCPVGHLCLVWCASRVLVLIAGARGSGNLGYRSATRMARSCTCHWKRYHEISRNLLASYADVCRASTAQAYLHAWVPDKGWLKDGKVIGKCRGAHPLGERLWFRCGSLFLLQLSLVWSRWWLQLWDLHQESQQQLGSTWINLAHPVHKCAHVTYKNSISSAWRGFAQSAEPVASWPAR